jgi:UDP-N-acetylglucosamine 3-dehydrogenase
MFRLGIVGAGVMGANHARVASGLPNVERVVICDRDPVRAAAVADGAGVLWARHLEALLPQVDAVVLATPSETHADLGSVILDSGLDLLVEKPIATTAEDAERLIQAARRAGRILMVGHVERFNAAVVELRNHLSGLIHLEFSRVGPYSPRIIGDVFLDLMIHDADLAHLLAGGEVVSASAFARTVRSSTEDLACALFEFDNGVGATLTSSRIGQNKVRRIVATQQDNVIVADLLRQQLEIHRVEHHEYVSEGGPRYQQVGRVEIPFLSQHGEPLARELGEFVGCVLERRPPAVSGEDGLAALRACLRARDHAARLAPREPALRIPALT